MIKPSEFVHPEDAAALNQMESIPGFPLLVKKVLQLGYEKLQYGTNMASAIRLSKTQLPEIYKHLPPICEKFGIVEPEFYLQMDPNPNAWTFGDSKIYITVISVLVEMMDDDELDAILSHECGHILCHHVLYHSVAQLLLTGIDSLNMFGTLTVPLQYAILYWSRKSELSWYRCSCIVTSPKIVTHVILLPQIAHNISEYFSNGGFDVKVDELISGGHDISISKGGMFKAVLGMRTALKVTLLPMDSDVNFEVDVGILGQQAIPIVISMFFFWPVIITQIWGMVTQSQLDDRALQVARNTAAANIGGYTSGKQDNGSQGAKFCTNCGAKKPLTAKFCSECGKPL